ncbi:hypothetical protein FOL47_000476 [Perkinsus chesapeaki]|uniref:Uncharacterized protein n=1 Tax=Perkinsus chesapeaki TaxID=330153 RepID=A0A7J6MMB3_PERCH|nr:hypothetical protein FOL47_000476 [Perkinsus chesapeaki]
MRSRLRSLLLLIGLGLYTVSFTVSSTKSLLLWLGNSDGTKAVVATPEQLALDFLDDRLLEAHAQALDRYVDCVTQNTASERPCRRDAMGVFDTIAAEVKTPKEVEKEAKVLINSARKLLQTGLEMLQAEVDRLRLAARAASDEQRQALAWIGEMAQRAKHREEAPKSTGVRLRGDALKNGGAFKDAISSILGSIEIKSPEGGLRFDSGGGENGVVCLSAVCWFMVRSVAAAKRGHSGSKVEKRRRLRSIGLLAGLIYGCGLLVTSFGPLWLFGSNSDNSDWSRPHLITSSSVGGEVSGELRDFLNDPLVNTDREQTWQHRYSHNQLGDLTLTGNDKDEWAANYLYNLPGKGLGTVEGALNSDQQLALQYSNAIQDGMLSGSAGWSSNDGYFGKLSKLWSSGNGKAARYDIAGNTNNGELKHQLQAQWARDNDRAEAGIQAPITNPYGFLTKGSKQFNPDWYTSYSRSLIDGGYDVKKPFGMEGGARLSSGGELEGRLTARAKPLDSIDAEYRVSAKTRPDTSKGWWGWLTGLGKSPVELEHNAQVQYSNAPGSVMYANYEKRDSSPGHLRLGYAMTSDDTH